MSQNRFLKNFSSLSLYQISEYLLPLITFPYLVRVLGPANYGLYQFAAGFIGYFLIVIDFGFYTTATRAVSLNKAESTKISEIFWSVYIIKIFLFAICLTAFISITESITLLEENNFLLYIMFIGLFGNLLFPNWLFQGFEEMKFLPMITIPVRSIKIILIFLVITESNDLIFLALLNSSSMVIRGITGFVLGSIKYRIKFIIPDLPAIKKYFSDSLSHFNILFFTNIKSTSNTFILGLFVSYEVVGVFAAAEKLKFAFESLLKVFNDSLFPRISRKLLSQQAIYLPPKKYLFASSAFIIASLSAFFLLAEKLVPFLLGDNYYSAIILLYFLLPAAVFVAVNHFLVYVILVNINKQNAVIFAQLISAVFHLIVVSLFSSLFGGIGMSAGILLSELTFFVFLLILFHKSKHLIKIK
ncbi:MAG: oligosaccharide flippase family protein [Bacteroidetes bacterium]|nr:oligosaccharide flippase family protein [Bacteroidota bacterium]